MFDPLQIDGEEVFVLKPEARRQLDWSEDFRRYMSDECREEDRRVRFEAAYVKPHDHIDDLGLTERGGPPTAGCRS